MDNSNSGDNGLPLIHSAITIEGNDSRIERQNGAAFRLFEIAADGVLTLNRVELSNGLASATTGAASAGGALLNRGKLTLNQSRISGSSAVQGGAISNQGVDAVVRLLNTSLVGNSATENGGGLFAAGGATTKVVDSTFSQNIANNNGGAIFTSDGASLSLRSSTVNSNHAAQKGGGLMASNAQTEVINSTITANSADISGGGLQSVLAGGFELLNSTVASNVSLLGAGVAANSGVFNIKNSLIAKAVNGSDCALTGSTVTEFSNWFGDDSCNGSSQGDPKLGPLADNGGPTWTLALEAASGAIDAANPVVCADMRVANLDQRGESRSEDDQCDIGAFERRDEAGDYMVIPLPGGKTAVIPL